MEQVRVRKRAGPPDTAEQDMEAGRAIIQQVGVAAPSGFHYFSLAVSSECYYSGSTVKSIGVASPRHCLYIMYFIMYIM